MGIQIKRQLTILKTCSCPFVRYFRTLFWDDITIICWWKLSKQTSYKTVRCRSIRGTSDQLYVYIFSCLRVGTVLVEKLAIYVSQKMAKFCLRSCWMTPKLFFTKIEFLGFRCTMIYQCFLPRLDCPGPFHKIMTVSNEKFDYILNHLVWQNCKNIAVTSQNNLKERIFVMVAHI